MFDSATNDSSRVAWSRIGQIMTAHVVMLRDVAVLDDPLAAVLLTAIDGATQGEPPAAGTLTDLIVAYDDRVDAVTQAAAVGAGAVGRGRAEIEAATIRLALRDDLLTLLAASAAARRAVLDLAGDHAFTLMPAYAAGQPVQPTTLAHFLGGVIAPLGRDAARLRTAYATVNQSPLGAVALASTALPVDRTRIAALLGFDVPIPSTFDALAAGDHLTASVEAAAALAATLRRFLSEVLTWLRTEPTSFRLPEAWLATSEPGLPSFRPPAAVEDLVVRTRRIEGDALTVVRTVREAPYGPLGVAGLTAGRLATEVIVAVSELATTTARLVAALEVNRAYLANRAGRDHTTSGELSHYLMVEEGLEPAAARNLAAMTIRKATEQGIEASGITPEMIDASALLVIGRELGVEIESLGRYLAPRRFLERREALGAPSPPATRAYLAAERTRLTADERWRDEAAGALDQSAADLSRQVTEMLENAT